jgi:hypothetical protein
VFVLHPASSLAQGSSGGTTAERKTATTRHDGQHDFDFEFGRWKAHNRRLQHPLSGSNEWVEFDGTLVAQPIWGGRATMDEYEADGPSGRVSGMTVQIYSRETHQWSLYGADSRTGAFSFPPSAGEFRNGRGEFYDQEEFHGRSILSRIMWTASIDAPRWEQAFSVDGGKTWETNWIVTYARVNDESVNVEREKAKP